MNIEDIPGIPQPDPMDYLETITKREWAEVLARLDKLEKLMTQMLVHQHQIYTASDNPKTSRPLASTRPIGMGSASV